MSLIRRIYWYQRAEHHYLSSLIDFGIVDYLYDIQHVQLVDLYDDIAVDSQR